MSVISARRKLTSDVVDAYRRGSSRTYQHLSGDQLCKLAETLPIDGLDFYHAAIEAGARGIIERFITAFAGARDAEEIAVFEAMWLRMTPESN
jgi:hypothetical protein